MRYCPGKQNVQEAIAALKSQREKIVPIRAAGQCLLQYHVEDKVRKENFPVKLWINPPAEIYLQGDIAFDPTGLVLGANTGEFWFWLKPKEISSYWWGTWSSAGYKRGLVLNPSAVLDGFGAVDFQNGDWSLTHGKYDILWQYNDSGELLKRVYIDTCDYRVAKVEYFDSSEKCSVRAEFSNYRKITEGFYVPASIKIVDANDNYVQISLGSVNITQFNEQQRNRLFVRPQPRGFEHIYRIIDGKAVEQGQQ